MHVESLHDDRVWSLVQSTLGSGTWRWTLFVETLGARIAGIELASRLEWLAERGHEIAQHTHHHLFEGERGHTTGFVRGRVLTDDDVHRCMDEGLEYLRRRGHHPIGFVSGNWLVLDSIFEWLSANGFQYDCTLRTYRPAGPHSTLAPNDRCLSTRKVGGVLQVPTTGTLKDEVRAQISATRRRVQAGNVSYRLFYLHDYDLLRRRVRLGARALQHRSPRATPVRDLLERLQDAPP